MKDCIIVGSGLAGVIFAHRLVERAKSFVIMTDDSQMSSQIAGGIFNPVVLKRFSPVWKVSEQLSVSSDFYMNIERILEQKFFLSIPIYRKFSSFQEQNDWFIATDKPILNEFLCTKLFSSPNSFINAPYAMGKVNKTGRLLVKDFLDFSLRYFVEKGLGESLRTTFDYEALQHTDDGVEYKGIKAKRIVFCEGFGVVSNPFFSYLPMRPCKGELLTFYAPELNCNDIIKSDGFVFREKDNLYKVGATYSWNDLTNSPTDKAKSHLIEKLDEIVSCPYHIVNQEAAIRPTVIDRRPILGKHPLWKNYWIFNGLGTRGVMLAPYASLILLRAIFDQQPIDWEMNIERFSKRYFPMI